ncbi:MAG: TetR/AcrR family transcriptional regulator [Brotaphodocola sp.]
MDIVEIKFKDGETTAGKLIEATQALIASYGYDATTTRMIANLAGVNLSAINFHFGNKENLVREALIKAGEDLTNYYCKMSDEVREFLKTDPMNKEKAWNYIDRMLTDRIRRTFNYRRSWINIGLVEHENGLPESSRGMLAERMIRDNEQILAELILAVSDKKDSFQAALVARSISAAIISYIEKPLLNHYMEQFMNVDFSDLDRVEDYMHDYFMKSIAAIATIDPSRRWG